MAEEISLSKQIRGSEKTKKPVDTKLATDERVLARITDGIYRQPDSALRELISNAYDADASEVIIQTDAPRFSQISVRDDGSGLSPEILEHLVKHIGGSAKRVNEGKDLGVTSKSDENLSPGGRKLIGKLGIGLFSVAQFTRHFLIITKTKDDDYRTVADITLGPVAGGQKLMNLDGKGHREIETGHAKIWREKAENQKSHGTEIKLLELLPRTRAELASEDLWTKIEYEKENSEELEGSPTEPPKLHIGRMKPKQTELLDVQPQLPWTEVDEPEERFAKFVQAIRSSVETDSDLVDLDVLCDRYLQTMWSLALSAPLEYFDIHPFDIPAEKDFVFFQLENSKKGQAKPLELKKGQTPRKELSLKSPNGNPGKEFNVFFDGVRLSRPILFTGLPRTSKALKTPLLFLGKDSQKFEKKPIQLSGGPLIFEAYLFWAPKIVPKQHQGVVLRVGNASGSLFDRTFMGYNVSEQNRLRQITAEIFVIDGLDGAINIDRESFNFAHPHYQYLTKWLHSALRQLANRQKGLEKVIRKTKVSSEGKKIRAEVEEKVEKSLRARGVEDVPQVILLDASRKSEVRKLRSEGNLVLQKDVVLPTSKSKAVTEQDKEHRKNAEKKAEAIAQLLKGWGLLEELNHSDQEKLIHDILEIVLLDI